MLCVLALAVAGFAALVVGATAGSAAAPRTSGSAYAVQINVPGAQSSGTRDSPAGSYTYRDLVSVHSYEAGSALSGERAYAHSDLTGVSLLGGFVTAESVLARTFADGSQDQATGTFGGTVTGLVVAGAAVSVQPGGQFEIPGIGYGAVNERRILRSDGAYRSSEVALHIHLSSDWHNLPAGTEILLGYAAAAATGHETVVRLSPGGPATPRHHGAPATAAARRAPTRPSSTPRSCPCLRATARRRTRATASRRRASRRRRPAASRSPRRSIRRAQAKLTAPGYVFPVAGGAHYGHDFGNFRGDTGFHQGSDLFAPEGTPLVAVQSGELHNVGWNRLGGWRLWIEDVNGNWFYYAHLSAFSPTSIDGGHVNAGDVVGFVGHTGDAVGTPSHLHFEVHPGGKWSVPPYDYLQAWQGHRNPFAAIPSEPPPVAAAQLGSTDISAASGLDTAAVLAVASGAPVEAGLVALGVPAPTAAELLAATPSP